MYTYGKHTTVSGYVESGLESLGAGEWPSAASTNYCYPSYTFDSATGTFTVTGNLGYFGGFEGVQGYVADAHPSKSGGKLFVSTWSEGVYYLRKKVAVSSTLKGAFVTSVLSPLGIYPDNGIYSDGYWYVKGTFVTNAPLTSLTSPTPNGTLFPSQSIVERGA